MNILPGRLKVEKVLDPHTAPTLEKRISTLAAVLRTSNHAGKSSIINHVPSIHGFAGNLPDLLMETFHCCG